MPLKDPEKRAEYNKAYRKANKEKINFLSKKYRKKHYEANKEKIAEYKKKRYEVDKERISRYNKTYRKANKEKLGKKDKECYRANKEKKAKHDKIYREINKERIAERTKIYQKANKEKIAEYKQQYYKANSDIFAKSRLKRTNKLKLTPKQSHADDLVIKQVYQLRYRINKCIGIPKLMHVDHIVPVSKGGLHTPGNLQILPAKINLGKSNKLIKVSTNFSI